MKDLPLCPCGSGKRYEECCWNIKDSAGNRKYDRGALSQDSKGIWHPIPNVAFKAVIHAEAVDDHSNYGLNLTQHLLLSPNHKNKLSKNLSTFHRAHARLIAFLQTPQGTNVSFSVDSIELRGLWRDYLMNGRILLDLLGLYSNLLLKFKRSIGGINRKKISIFKSELMDNCSSEKRIAFDSIECLLIDFIDLRDLEKAEAYTLIEPPMVFPDGIARGGKLRGKEGREFDFIEFLRTSHNAITTFINIVLL